MYTRGCAELLLNAFKSSLIYISIFAFAIGISEASLNFSVTPDVFRVSHKIRPCLIRLRVVILRVSVFCFFIFIFLLYFNVLFYLVVRMTGMSCYVGKNASLSVRKSLLLGMSQT